MGVCVCVGDRCMVLVYCVCSVGRLFDISFPEYHV